MEDLGLPLGEVPWAAADMGCNIVVGGPPPWGVATEDILGRYLVRLGCKELLGDSEER